MPQTVNWCSNDYLCMGQTEEVVGAAEAAAQHQHTGVHGIRSSSHIALEKEVAALHGKSDCRVFNSCYTANEAAINAIVRCHPGCVILSDKSNHASMIQGVRQSSAPKLLWEHNDVQQLEEMLAAQPLDAPKLVVYESVYSMDGSVGPLKEIVDLCKKYNAMSFLDEVHAVGLYGSEGAGVAQRDGVMDGVDFITGTLGKAYGVMGEYVVMDKRVGATMEQYINDHLPYQNEAFLPPSIAEAALASVKALRGETGTTMRSMHQSHAEKLKQTLIEKGFPVQPSKSHIVPVLVGDAVKCKQASDMLFSEYGIYVQPINYPTVPRGTERLRFTPGPLHTSAMQENLVTALEDVWDRLDIQATA